MQRFVDGYDYPGQSYPCDCELNGILRNDAEEEAATNRDESGHSQKCRNGYMIFRARPLEETDFCERLDRFWADWVSRCLLVILCIVT